jgi:hypothetical protein
LLQLAKSGYGSANIVGSLSTLRYQARNRLVMARNDNFLSLGHPVEQLTETGLCLERSHLSHGLLLDHI